jgi:hypothetical protein
MIQENLEYDENNQCWITSYPWKVDPSTLPNNYSVVLGTLKSTERTLSKDQHWAETYQKQMEDMENRKVARKLSTRELQEWEGPVFYISHLAVLNPRSNSTPVRIVFNSSQVSQGKSLNSCLAKGPDCYMNNLIGILLRWRERQVAMVGDIKKMFNSIHLKPLEQHCHRFLWRNLQSDRDPDVYVMTRVNMGDTPAPAISTEAIYKTADLFKNESIHQASKVLKESSYVDDLIDSCASKSEALKLCHEVEEILTKGGFKVKCWQLSGESNPRVGDELLDDSEVEAGQSQCERTHTLLKGTDENLRVLGLGWNPKNDTVVYEVRGEVQKRTSGKAYGVIFTDMAIRAVHIEAVFGYDTSSFLMALSRFASVRGWPERIYSDPGPQLMGAAKELQITIPWEVPGKTWLRPRVEECKTPRCKFFVYFVYNSRVDCKTITHCLYRFYRFASVRFKTLRTLFSIKECYYMKCVNSRGIETYSIRVQIVSKTHSDSPQSKETSFN